MRSVGRFAVAATVLAVVSAPLPARALPVVTLFSRTHAAASGWPTTVVDLTPKPSAWAKAWQLAGYGVTGFTLAADVVGGSGSLLRIGSALGLILIGKAIADVLAPDHVARAMHRLSAPLLSSAQRERRVQVHDRIHGLHAKIERLNHDEAPLFALAFERLVHHRDRALNLPLGFDRNAAKVERLVGVFERAVDQAASAAPPQPTLPRP
jgi:hypothetical protein